MPQLSKLTTYLNVFFKKITHKKQYTQKLNNKFFFFNKNTLQNNKKLNDKMPMKKHNIFLITYIIEIFFHISNTLVQITNSFGKLKFFCSAGSLLFKGKTKKARVSVVKTVIQILINKLIFLQNKPIMLRFKNVGFKKGWLVNRFKQKFFIKLITNLNLYAHNGCRKKKIKRRKHN